VELENVFVEGFVRKDSLGSDMWDYDKRHNQLTGLRTKKSYRMGDKLDVRVVKVDIKRGQADFEVVTKK
jgi:ribonuclease R